MDEKTRRARLRVAIEIDAVAVAVARRIIPLHAAGHYHTANVMADEATQLMLMAQTFRAEVVYLHYRLT